MIALIKHISIIALAITMAACATPKVTVDSFVDTSVNNDIDSLLYGGDSTTSVHTELSAGNTQHTDSSSISNTNIAAELTFGPNGGTFNPLTGEATGVQSAKIQADINKLNRTINDQKTEITLLHDSITSIKDSLTYYRNQSNSQVKEETHTTQDAPSKPFGRKFCIVCTILFWLIVALIILAFIIRIRSYLMSRF